jgi:glycosyltransferase involved in cell wall biosynthesis
MKRGERAAMNSPCPPTTRATKCAFTYPCQQSIGQNSNSCASSYAGASVLPPPCLRGRGGERRREKPLVRGGRSSTRNSRVGGGRAPRIRFLGHVEGRGLADLYRQADVLVVPSPCEPWGLVVHEGLAYGLSVIATDQVGAGNDLLDPGANDYVIPAGSSQALAEGMQAVAGWTDDQWERAATRSREVLAECSIDRAVEGFIRGYSLALKHRRRR